MPIPILSARRDRRQTEIQAAITAGIEAGLEKALTPAVMSAGNAVPGVSYPADFNPSSPFNQTAGAMASPLPRPYDTFGSLFGPGSPLTPDALDRLRPDGRADARRWQYPVTVNLQLGQYGAPWSTLYDIATNVDVVSHCLNLVCDAISGMEWSFSFSNQVIDQIRLENNEPNSAKAIALARDKYGEELTRVQKFWQYPDEEMDQTFSQWLSAVVWAHLVYDGLPIIPKYTLGGDLHSLSLIDTSSIKRLVNDYGFPPQPPAPAFQQVLYGFPRSEFQADNYDGPVEGEYRRDQMAYFVRRYRPKTLYGFSIVEECIPYATLYQQRQEWLHAEWSHGSTPKGVIKTTGTEGWTPEQFSYFQTSVNDQWSGQTQRRQQVMVLRPGMEWDQLKDFAELYTTTFDEWITMQLGSKFGVPQQQLGIPMHSFARSGVQNQTSMDLTDKFSLDSLVNFLVDCINRLNSRFMGVGPEITVTATSGNGDQSDYQRAQADASDVNNGIRTRNEVRQERGLPLMSDPEMDVAVVVAGNAVIFLPGQLAYQEASERAIEEGSIATAEPNVATPSENAQNKPPTQANAPADPKSKSNVAETTNRAVGHISPGTDMVSHGTDRKAQATRQTGAPQSSSAAGSYTEKSRELAAFTKFAKARFSGTKNYRVFEFHHVDPATATTLNNIAYDGTLDDLKPVIADVLAKSATPPTAAGLCVRAIDTQRVLMLQRRLDDTDPASGKFEFPGGHVEPGGTSYEAACREFTEETGTPCPDGTVVNEWLSPDGVYQLYVMEVPSEADVAINMDQHAGTPFNPDDPDGDAPEIATWWSVESILGNPAIRTEVALVNPTILQPPVIKYQ
jgi:8-oxo-dGTP pyrophosphatase MutT (NUDIX family)